MNNIFDAYENISPFFTVNKNTDIEKEESLNSESKLPKKIKEKQCKFYYFYYFYNK